MHWLEIHLEWDILTLLWSWNHIDEVIQVVRVVDKKNNNNSGGESWMMFIWIDKLFER